MPRIDFSWDDLGQFPPHVQEALTRLLTQQEAARHVERVGPPAPSMGLPSHGDWPDQSVERRDVDRRTMSGGGRLLEPFKDPLQEE